MSGPRELADGAEAHQLALLDVTPAQRHRARLQVMQAGRDLKDRRQLLAALGLDGHDTIRAERTPPTGRPHVTATISHTILAEEGPTEVQAQPATPGLYVYQLPDTVNVGAPCRWSLGHHSGFYIGRFRSAEQAHAAAAAVADWGDWTQARTAITARITGPNRDPAAGRDLLDRIESAGGHIGNCGLCEP